VSGKQHILAAMPDWQLWRHHFASVFVPQIELYGRMWKERFLPALAELENEARAVEEKEQQRLSTEVDPESFDPDGVAEQAYEAGLAYYEPFAPIRQGLTNMYAIGLHHLVEQQVLLFFRQVTPASGPSSKRERDPSFKDVRHLLEAYGVVVAQLRSWPMMQKLKLLADCVKHAEGRACRKLLKRERGWFNPPLVGRPRVRQPLFGQGIYLDEGTLWDLTDAARSFWAELGDALTGT